MLWRMLNSSGVVGSEMDELGGAIADERTMGDDDVAHSTRWTHVEFARFISACRQILNFNNLSKTIQREAGND
jgi:hypothetical protein